MDLAAPLFQSRLPMRLRVAPHPASSGSAGDRSSSCPESHILQHLRRTSFGLPLGFALPVVPADVSSRLPRIPHLPALPAMELRVASNFASFSVPGAEAWGFPARLCSPVTPADEVPGLPRFPHLPAVPATDLRVTPNLSSFNASGAGASGFPWASRFQLRLPVWLRVAPPLSPSGFALGSILRVSPVSRSFGSGWWFAELPRFPHPPASPSLRIRVSPNPASTAGSMMTSRLSSNFASSADPRMNLRG